MVAIKSGSQTTNINDFIHGGRVAGLIEYRKNSLEETQRSMDRLALTIQDQMNKQNKLGMDYYGNLGGNIFKDINSAEAMSQRVITNTKNTGTASLTVNIDDASLLTTSDYQIEFPTASTYVLKRISDDVVLSSGAVGTLPQQISADGFTVNINSGSIIAGDKFKISPTKNGSTNMGISINEARLIAVGMPVVAQGSTNNTGSGDIKVDTITDPSNSSFSTPNQLSHHLE